jgi:hypothetical protein
MQLDHLQKAFALAMAAALNDKYEYATRAVFRAIAYQIWLGCGNKSEEMPNAAKR